MTLYKLPRQNALQKCPLQKVAPKPKLPSKTPCQNSLPKRLTKVSSTKSGLET
jgi:hypothetical protein